MSTLHPPPSSEAPAARVSQRGVLHLNPARCGPTVPAGLQRGLAAAVAQGSGAALLYLGGRCQASTLPAPLAFWCRFAQAFLTAVCLAPNLEAQRGSLGLAPPQDLPKWLELLPPMDGGEHVDAGVLAALWEELQQALADALRDFEGSVAEYLHALNPAWNSLGRVCFHLADNKADAQRPFAFLATYSEGLGASNRPRHLPLSTALRTYAGQAQAQAEALARVLEPVKRAAAHSALVKELLQTKALFAPQAWDARAVYRFLREIPVLESSGVAVRVPDWWHRRARPRVVATVGSQRASGLGLAALLDVDLQVMMDGEPLSREEWQSLAGQTGLVQLRGRWVEVDGARLQQALHHMEALQRDNPEGLDFAAGMRLLAGMPKSTPDADADDPEPIAWAQAQAGPWLREALASLRSGEAWRAPAGLKATLRPYQQVGVQWLHGLGRLGLGACLADDMGLGKTLQVIALLLGSPGPSLLVVPASLLANWQQECKRFAPGLRLRVAHASAEDPATSSVDADAVLTTYGMVVRHAWLREAAWERVVLDEAQAIKNAGSRQARAVKQVRAQQRIALTGTPVENRAADLWSLFDFINPGMLGSAHTFAKHVKVFEAPKGDGYAPLRRLVSPYILRRLKTDKAVVPDLPDKTELVAWCGLRKEQAALYQGTVEDLERRLEDLAPMERRGLILATMTRLKQICNHPSQCLGDKVYAPAQSGKYRRLAELGASIAACGEKVLVFTQYREMTEPLRAFLAEVFGTPGFVLHGGTAVKARQALVQRFNDEDAATFFVLSLKAGGTGLNLTGANHVVHFDRWWNPAVENQATDRAFRIGQQRNVLVHKFVCRGTVEERIDTMLHDKRKLSDDLLSGKAELSLTEMSDADLLATVRLDLDAALAGD